MADDINMLLGGFFFSVSTVMYQQIKRKTEFGWSQIDTMLTKPGQQYVGMGTDMLTINGFVLPRSDFFFNSGSQAQLEYIRAQGKLGLPLPLFVLDYDLSVSMAGFWVLLSIEEDMTKMARNGLPQKIDFELVLKHFPIAFSATNVKGINVIESLWDAARLVYSATKHYENYRFGFSAYDDVNAEQNTSTTTKTTSTTQNADGSTTTVTTTS